MGDSSKRKPIAIHLHDPKQHLTKQAIKDRVEAEVVMGEVSFTAPDAVKKSKEAFTKWKEVTKIYRDSGLLLVSSTDNGVLGRYCLLYADYWDLVEQRRIVSGFSMPAKDTEDLVKLTEDQFNHDRARQLWSIMECFTSLDGLLKLDKAINAKVKSILDVEDRIFLNPASKVRTLPIKKKSKETDELGDMGFDV